MHGIITPDFSNERRVFLVYFRVSREPFFSSPKEAEAAGSYAHIPLKMLINFRDMRSFQNLSKGVKCVTHLLRTSNPLLRAYLT